MEHIQKTIDDAILKLKDLEREVAETKELVNRLRGFMKQGPMFEVTTPDSAAAAAGLKGDEYVGAVLQTAIRSVMDRRKSLGLSPCTLDEIYSDLKAGGFRFETRDEANAKKGVYNNLTRGSGAVFFRLSNDKWGLMSWYPGVKRKKEDKDEKGDKGGAGGDQDDAGESQSAQSGTKENE